MGDTWSRRVVLVLVTIISLAWLACVGMTFINPAYKMPDSVSTVMNFLMIPVGGAIAKLLIGPNENRNGKP